MKMNKLRAVDIIKGTVTFDAVERPLVREYIQKWNSLPDDPVLQKFDILVHFPIVDVCESVGMCSVCRRFQDGIKIQWGNSTHQYSLFSIAEISSYVASNRYEVT